MHIQEFSVGNFKSFKDINTLSLMATKSISNHKSVDENNLFEIPNSLGVKVMKTKAIYGANSSGKSNIIKALSVFIDIVKNSVIDKSILGKVDKYRFNTSLQQLPSFFQIVFWDEGVRYRYGFEISKDEVSAEWLYHKPNKREEPLFIRDGQKIIEVNKKHFQEGAILQSFAELDKEKNSLFRSNALVLTTLSTFGFANISSNIIKVLSSINIINGLGDFGLMQSAGEKLEDENMKNYILNILKFGDIGIKGIDFFKYGDEDNDEKTKEKKKEKNINVIYSLRPKFNDENEEMKEYGVLYFGEESEGTKKLFEISPFIYESFKNDTPLIIDEFDARFHPLLTREIIKLFNTKGSKNPQLIFTTHDTNLMDNKIFRKDQIDFVEKDSFSCSHLYSLIEFKGERNSKTFESDYIKGKYGAIPFLGDFTKLYDLIENA